MGYATQSHLKDIFEIKWLPKVDFRLGKFNNPEHMISFGTILVLAGHEPEEKSTSGKNKIP